MAGILLLVLVKHASGDHVIWAANSEREAIALCEEDGHLGKPIGEAISHAGAMHNKSLNRIYSTMKYLLLAGRIAWKLLTRRQDAIKTLIIKEPLTVPQTYVWTMFLRRPDIIELTTR